MSDRIPVGYGEFRIFSTMTGDDDPMVASLGFQYADPPATSGELDDAVHAICEAFASCTTDGLFHGTDGTCTIFGNDPDDAVTPYGGDIEEGVLTGNPVPINCAMIVQKRTLFGGRRNRGRIFLAGTPETEVSGNGEITLSRRNTTAAVFNSLQADVVAVWDGFTQFVLLHNGAPFTPTGIAVWTVGSKVGTLRRRIVN